ncbi:MAG: hypothetical protein ABW321_32125, partial [Polyangiales bacterium]
TARRKWVKSTAPVPKDERILAAVTDVQTLGQPLGAATHLNQASTTSHRAAAPIAPNTPRDTTAGEAAPAEPPAPSLLPAHLK